MISKKTDEEASFRITLKKETRSGGGDKVPFSGTSGLLAPLILIGRGTEGEWLWLKE